MKIAVLKERAEGETRVALTPETAKKFIALGADVAVEAGAGENASIADAAYTDAGASVGTADQVVTDAGIVLGVQAPDPALLKGAKPDAKVAALFDPFRDGERVDAYAKAGLEALSMEFMPRITRAQSMDVLSSQSNLSGYKAVMAAANQYGRAFPMMMTAAGTVQAARVFVMGVGVAGLQAIATAKRLGAKVVAFDTRSVVAEQVQSLGGKFLEIDLGETGQTKDGYAQELTPEQLEKQKEGQKQQIAESDIVITTAQVPGRRAPLLIPAEVVAGMRPGSVIVDMAADSATYDLHTITRLQQLKTGALLTASVEMGAILGRVPPESRAPLLNYARDIGLAFQIVDDLLDHEGDEDKAGKALRKDEEQGKQTFVSLMGADAARSQAKALIEQACGHLAHYGEDAGVLCDLARYIVERDR